MGYLYRLFAKSQMKTQISSVKLAVVYYSSSGTNVQFAEWAKEAATEVGAEVKVVKVKETAPDSAIDSNPAWRANVDATQNIPEATPDDLAWADAILFSVPTRFGNMPGQMKSFLDTTGGLWASGKLANKVVSAMSSAQNPHGGQEATILSLYTTMYHWGAIVVAPGFTDPSTFGAGGNPYGTSVTVDQEGKMIEDVQAAVKYQTQRMVTIAEALKKTDLNR